MFIKTRRWLFRMLGAIAYRLAKVGPMRDLRRGFCGQRVRLGCDRRICMSCNLGDTTKMKHSALSAGKTSRRKKRLKIIVRRPSWTPKMNLDNYMR